MASAAAVLVWRGVALSSLCSVHQGGAAQRGVAWRGAALHGTAAPRLGLAQAWPWARHSACSHSRGVLGWAAGCCYWLLYWPRYYCHFTGSGTRPPLIGHSAKTCTVGSSRSKTTFYLKDILFLLEEGICRFCTRESSTIKKYVVILRSICCNGTIFVVTVRHFSYENNPHRSKTTTTAKNCSKTVVHFRQNF